jgi:hypothetical protein
MSTLIPEVSGGDQNIRTAEFVRWVKYDNATDTATTYTFSSAYKDETWTIDGQQVVFEAVGGLLSVGSQQKDISVSGFDTSIILMGVDPDEVWRVVDRSTKGSEITIYRGFYDEQYNLTNMYLRFTGIVTSYTTDETYEAIENTINLILNCSATKYSLERLYSGRKTNSESWKQYAPSDTSMDKIPSLIGVQFDFGKKV